MHQSVATIDSPQFLNLQPLDINPLMSKCEIKVFYIGANRNHSFINEQVAIEIGKTLRGAPIVGYYRDSKEDFTDHGEKIIIDDEGIKFQCQTVPYGFVSPDAEVWFQNFEDTDAMGNTVIHKYLMTTGYLWTGQFPESSLPVNQGRPQSMELHPDSIDGKWETSYDNGMDYFIINDAIIQKICILGDDVEPCFEGASVTAPNVSTSFTLDEKFKHTLFSMMQDLKNALEKGGQQMNSLENSEVLEEEVSENTEEITEAEISEVDEIENTSGPEDYTEEVNEDEDEENVESDEQVIEEENDEIEQAQQETSSDYEAMQTELNELKNAYSLLQAQYQDLVNFKNEIDNQKKDALIAEFYMLSDEDKVDVIQNKEKYTLDEIKAKLSVICFDKKINFSLNNDDTEDNKDMTIIYNLNNINSDSNLPDWVKAVKEQEKLG